MEGKGYMMSGECWLRSTYSSPASPPRSICNTFTQLDEEEEEEEEEGRAGGGNLSCSTMGCIPWE